MAVDLTGIPIAAADPRLIDYGGTLEPILGGDIQKLERLGTRHALAVSVPPLRSASAGRQWVQRLKRAKLEGGVVAWPQPDFNTGAPGAPVVNGAVFAQAKVLPLRGLAPGYVVREGQYLSIIHGGRRYLHSADADGSASVSITPRLRVALSDGDTVEIAVPKIEGWIEGDELAWSLDAARTTGLAFSVVEKG